MEARCELIAQLLKDRIIPTECRLRQPRPPGFVRWIRPR